MVRNELEKRTLMPKTFQLDINKKNSGEVVDERVLGKEEPTENVNIQNKIREIRKENDTVIGEVVDKIKGIFEDILKELKEERREQRNIKEMINLYGRTWNENQHIWSGKWKVLEEKTEDIEKRLSNLELNKFNREGKSASWKKLENMIQELDGVVRNGASK